jgi:hypothetical protein
VVVHKLDGRKWPWIFRLAVGTGSFQSLFTAASSETAKKKVCRYSRVPGGQYKLSQAEWSVSIACGLIKCIACLCRASFGLDQWWLSEAWIEFNKH